MVKHKDIKESYLEDTRRGLLHDVTTDPANKTTGSHPGIGRIPTTDQEAIESCHDCRRLVNGQCELLGIINLQTRNTCHDAGYYDFKYPETWSARKLPRYKPQP